MALPAQSERPQGEITTLLGRGSEFEGKLTFEDGISEPGKYVEMRAETDVLCLISNCPQLNNPCNAYNPTPVEVLIWD